MSESHLVVSSGEFVTENSDVDNDGDNDVVGDDTGDDVITSDGIHHNSVITTTVINLARNTTDWRELLNTTMFQVRVVMIIMVMIITLIMVMIIMMIMVVMVVMMMVMLQDYPEWMLMSGFGCCLMFLVCGLPGNIITILALARCKKVRNISQIIYCLSFWLSQPNENTTQHNLPRPTPTETQR